MVEKRIDDKTWILANKALLLTFLGGGGHFPSVNLSIRLVTKENTLDPFYFFFNRTKSSLLIDIIRYFFYVYFVLCFLFVISTTFLSFKSVNLKSVKCIQLCTV